MQREYTESTEHTQAEIITDDSWMDRIVVPEGILSRRQERKLIHREALALQNNPPKTSKDKFAIGVGRRASMLIRDTSDPNWALKPVVYKYQTWQVKGSFTAWTGSLEELASEISGWSGPGNKGDGMAMYAAVPLVDGGPPRKDNVAFTQGIFEDLDAGALLSPEDVDRARGAIQRRGWAAILFSTSTSRRSVPKIRLFFLSDISLTNEEHRIVAQEIMEEIKADIGTTEGWDPMSVVATIPMSAPRWGYGDEAKIREAEAWKPEVIHGEAIKVSERIARVREKVQEMRDAEEARMAAFAAVGRLADTISTEDRISAALEVLEDEGLVGLQHGRGETDGGTWKAAMVCASWGLEADQIEGLLLQTSPDLDYKIVSHKAADAARLIPPWRLKRAASASRARQDDQIFDEVEEIGGASPRHTRSLNRYETTSCVTGGVEGVTHVLGDSKEESGTSAASLRTPFGPLPLTTVNQRYLDRRNSFGEFRKGLTFIKSPMGTGKNACLKGAWEELAQRQGRGVGVSHRQTITRAQSGAWDLPNYLDHKKGAIEGTASVCLNSLDRVALWRFAGEEIETIPLHALVLDEMEQGVRHMFSGVSRKSGSTIEQWRALKRLLLAAEHTIIQDADLSGLTFRVLKRILGDAPVSAEVLVNTYRPENRKAILFSDKATWLKGLRQSTQGIKTWTSCTSRAAAARIHRILSKDNPNGKGLLVHQGTVGLPEVQACLHQPELFSQYDWVVHSPSISSSLSYDTEDVFEVWCHARTGDGSIAQDVAQSFSRVRSPLGSVVRIFAGRGNLRQTQKDPARILEDLHLLNKQTLRLLEGIPHEVDPVAKRVAAEDEDMLACYAEVLAYEARWGKLHKSKDGEEGALAPHLRGIGFSVDWCDEQAGAEEAEETKAIEDAVKVEVEEEKAEAVLAAPEITDQEREELGRGAGTPDNEAKIIRHDIERFKGKPISDKEEVLKDRGGKRREEVAFGLRSLAWQRGFREKVLERDERAIAGNGQASMVHCPHRSLQAAFSARVWAMLGAPDLEEAARNGVVLQPPKGPIPAALCADIKRILGISVTPETSWYRLASLLARKAGFSLSPNQHRENGKQVRSYQIKLVSFEELLSDGAKYFADLTGQTPEKSLWEPVPFDEREMIESLLE